MTAKYEVLGTSKPDNLHAGVEVPLLTKGVELASGQGILERGSVIGIVAESGLGKLCNKAAEDGSEVANCILVHDVDTTGTAAVTSVCYQSGLFHRNALIFGGESTADDHVEELRSGGIFLRDEYPIE